MRALVRDRQVAEPVRLAGVSALSRALDKGSVDTLIWLLDSPEPNLRPAAANALAKLTGIRSFGTDSQRWRTWWAANKDKSRQDWLADLADGLSRQNASLETDLTRLHARLASTMEDLYNTTPPANRPALLVGFLKDALPDVRVRGLDLTDRRAAKAEPLAAETAGLVKALMGDDDPGVRAAAVKVFATLNDPDAPAVLMKRLDSEPVDIVRQALVTALGALRVPQATDRLLQALADEPNGTAVAAALALDRVVAAAPLSDAQQVKAVEVVSKRYGQAGASQRELREALLETMGILGRSEFASDMHSAVADDDPAVRLAGVRGLQKLNNPAAADAVAPLVADADRGVRLAAISALGSFASADYLELLMNRTRAEVEADPAVRDKAWEAVTSLLAKAPVEKVRATVDSLANRPDATLYRATAGQPGGPPGRRPARPASPPGSSWLRRSRPPAGPPRRPSNWPRRTSPWPRTPPRPAPFGRAGSRPCWPPTIPRAWRIAAQKDPNLFAEAVQLLLDDSASDQAAGKHAVVIAMCEQSLGALKDRLTAAQQTALSRLLEQSRAQQITADRQKVGQLLQQIVSGDEAARKSTTGNLEAMRHRAVRPLVEQLRESLAADPPKPAVEGIIVATLVKLAPDLNGYDLQATRTIKLKVIDGWLTSLGG